MKKNTRIVTRKLRVLQSELRMLQRYSTDMSALYQEYEKEYFCDMVKLVDAASALISATPTEDEKEEPSIHPHEEVINIDPNDPNQRWRKTADGKWVRDDVDEDLCDSSPEKIIETPPWARKLYKKIAMASHPDRTSRDINHEKFKEIFLKSAAAVDSGNFKELLGLALELDIDVDSEDALMIPLLESRIQEIKKDLGNVESTAEWLWGEGLGIPQMRFPLAQLYLKSKGYELKSEDIISIIAKVEEQ